MTKKRMTTQPTAWYAMTCAPLLASVAVPETVTIYAEWALFENGKWVAGSRKGKKLRKDSQRQRVYDAEQGMFRDMHGKYLGDIFECQQFVNRVTRRVYVQKKYQAPHIIVKGVPQKTTKAHAVSGYFLAPAIEVGTGQMAAWSRTDAVMLHEIAHHLTGVKRGHDWKFAAIFLDLVRNVMGKEAHACLKAKFKEKKVRYREPRKRKPRVLTPEQKAAQTARLAKARAKREAELAPKRAMKERAIKLHHRMKTNKRTPQGRVCYDHYLGHPKDSRSVWIEKDPKYLSYEKIEDRLKLYDKAYGAPVDPYAFANPISPEHRIMMEMQREFPLHPTDLTLVRGITS